MFWYKISVWHTLQGFSNRICICGDINFWNYFQNLERSVSKLKILKIHKADKGLIYFGIKSIINWLKADLFFIFIHPHRWWLSGSRWWGRRWRVTLIVLCKIHTDMHHDCSRAVRTYIPTRYRYKMHHVPLINQYLNRFRAIECIADQKTTIAV